MIHAQTHSLQDSSSKSTWVVRGGIQLRLTFLWVLEGHGHWELKCRQAPLFVSFVCSSSTCLDRCREAASLSLSINLAFTVHPALAFLWDPSLAKPTHPGPVFFEKTADLQHMTAKLAHKATVPKRHQAQYKWWPASSRTGAFPKKPYTMTDFSLHKWPTQAHSTSGLSYQSISHSVWPVSPHPHHKTDCLFRLIKLKVGYFLPLDHWLPFS